MSFKHWLYRKGAQPQKSLLWVVVGFAIFAAGGYLLATEFYYQLPFRLAGYALVLTGFVLAINGWLGIIANRIALFINVPGGRFADKQDTDNPE